MHLKELFMTGYSRTRLETFQVIQRNDWVLCENTAESKEHIFFSFPTLPTSGM